MTIDEFVHLVGRMRKLQRQFFKTNYRDRPPAMQKQCEDLEKKVDREILARRECPPLPGLEETQR